MSYYQVVRTSIKNHQDTFTEVVCTTEDFTQASSYLVTLIAESFSAANQMSNVKTLLYDGMSFDEYLERNSVSAEEQEITIDEIARATGMMPPQFANHDEENDDDDDEELDANDVVGVQTQYTVQFPSQLHIEYEEAGGAHYDEIYHIAEIFAQLEEPV